MISENSSPEQPGTAIFHAEYGPDGVKTAITVTRADRWILVNREFAARMHDEGELSGLPLTLIVGRPHSVMYRFDRKFNEHSDLYERIDEPAGAEPDEGVTDLDPEVAELLASNERPVLTAEDYQRINPTCEHGLIKDLITCPRVVEESARAMIIGRVKGYRNPLQPRVDELTRVLNEVLASFTEKGHPGEECLRAGWIGTRHVARWRRIAAGRPSFDEMLEQLIDVKLTDEQRTMMRDVWEYREAHGRWPSVIHRGRRDGVATEREALCQLIEISQRTDEA